MRSKSTYRISDVLVIPLLFGISTLEAFDNSVQFKPDKPSYHSTLMDTCKPMKIQAINISEADIENPEFQLVDTGVFHIQENFKNCPNPLGPGEKCQVYIDFCPPHSGKYEATLTFSGSAQAIHLKGRGSAGR